MKDGRLNGGGGVRAFVVINTILKKYNGNEESLRLPGFVYAIYNGAFAGNKTLKEISLSGNVSVIGDNAFDGCESLKKIILPYGLTTIGKLAFKGCSSLTDLIFDGIKEQWLTVKKGEGWFDGAPDFVIRCKDCDISRREEIEAESEPQVNFEKLTAASDAVPDEEPAKEYDPVERIDYVAHLLDDDDDDDDDDDEDDDDDDDEDLGFDDEGFIDDELRYNALKAGIENGKVSVSMLQRKFKIGYIKACNLLDWMEAEGYAETIGGSSLAPCRVIITLEELEKLYADGWGQVSGDTEEEGDGEMIAERLLEKVRRRDAMQKLANVLSKIAQKKQEDVTAEEMPSHSLWEDEDVFGATVMERLEKLMRSDLKMARRGAINKAETYLEAVRLTRDGKTLQVISRVVYELKTLSDRQYNEIREYMRKGY